MPAQKMMTMIQKPKLWLPNGKHVTSQKSLLWQAKKMMKLWSKCAPKFTDGEKSGNREVLENLKFWKANPTISREFWLELKRLTSALLITIYRKKIFSVSLNRWRLATMPGLGQAMTFLMRSPKLRNSVLSSPQRKISITSKLPSRRPAKKMKLFLPKWKRKRKKVKRKNNDLLMTEIISNMSIHPTSYFNTNWNCTYIVIFKSMSVWALQIMEN